MVAVRDRAGLSAGRSFRSQPVRAYLRDDPDVEWPLPRYRAGARTGIDSPPLARIRRELRQRDVRAPCLPEPDVTDGFVEAVEHPRVGSGEDGLTHRELFEARAVGPHFQNEREAFGEVTVAPVVHGDLADAPGALQVQENPWVVLDVGVSPVAILENSVHESAGARMRTGVDGAQRYRMVSSNASYHAHARRKCRGAEQQGEREHGRPDRRPPNGLAAPAPPDGALEQDREARNACACRGCLVFPRRCLIKSGGARHN